MKVGRAQPTGLDMMSLVFRGLLFSSKKSLVAQAKTCGYILSIYPLNTEYKIPAGHYCPEPPLAKGGIKTCLSEVT